MTRTDEKANDGDPSHQVQASSKHQARPSSPQDPRKQVLLSLPVSQMSKLRHGAAGITQPAPEEPAQDPSPNSEPHQLTQTSPARSHMEKYAAQAPAGASRPDPSKTGKMEEKKSRLILW